LCVVTFYLENQGTTAFLCDEMTGETK